MFNQDFMEEEINKVQYQNMVYNYQIDPVIIKTRLEKAKITYKYPIHTIINIIHISRNNLKSFSEIKDYYTELLLTVNSLLDDTEKYNNDELEIFLKYMIIHYYQLVRKEEDVIREVNTYMQGFEQYYDIKFDDVVVEYCKNEYLYQVLIYLSIDTENYENGSISKLLRYLHSIKKHPPVNIEEKNEGIN
jgi:hypothetical protein